MGTASEDSARIAPDNCARNCAAAHHRRVGAVERVLEVGRVGRAVAARRPLVVVLALRPRLPGERGRGRRGRGARRGGAARGRAARTWYLPAPAPSLLSTLYGFISFPGAIALQTAWSHAPLSMRGAVNFGQPASFGARRYIRSPHVHARKCVRRLSSGRGVDEFSGRMAVEFTGTIACCCCCAGSERAKEPRASIFESPRAR